MNSLSTQTLCGKCLAQMSACSCQRTNWQDDPAIPESVKQFIRAYAVISKVA